MKELIIVKVGTTTLTDETGRLDEASFMNIANALKEEKERGADTMLISSAAITAGAAELGIDRRQYADDPDSLSALAASGQIPLMNRWSRYLEPCHVSQHLITPYELHTAEGDAYITKLMAAFRLGLLPVANENDAVADDEIKFGDNDRLMALIAVGLAKKAVWDTIKPVILTDVDGLYTAEPSDPQAELIRTVTDINDVAQFAVETDTVHNSGGMRTKLIAARMLLEEGVGMRLGYGRAEDPIGRLLHGAAGTYFMPAA